MYDSDINGRSTIVFQFLQFQATNLRRFRLPLRYHPAAPHQPATSWTRTPQSWSDRTQTYINIVLAFATTYSENFRNNSLYSSSIHMVSRDSKSKTQSHTTMWSQTWVLTEWGASSDGRLTSASSPFSWSSSVSQKENSLDPIGSVQTSIAVPALFHTLKHIGPTFQFH